MNTDPGERLPEPGPDTSGEPNQGDERPDSAQPVAAIVIAGGRGSRMGGVDKPALELDGRTLLERIVDAARAAGCTPVVTVGREVGGGPVSALAAGLERLDTGTPVVGDPATRRTNPGEISYESRDLLPQSDEVLLLAGDLVHPERLLPLLAAGPADDADGLVLVDPAGREQWLAGRYRGSALRRALEALGDPVDASLRRLLGGLRLARLTADAETLADIDTWEDYERAKGGRHG